MEDNKVLTNEVRNALIKLSRENKKISLNNMQIELNIGFNSALRLKDHLISNNIINSKGELICQLEEDDNN